jgi:transposase
VFDASTYSKNQARLPARSVAYLFFAEVVDFARRQGWVSNETFGVDGTLIESWASLNRFRPKDDQQGPRRGNA